MKFDPRRPRGATADGERPYVVIDTSVAFKWFVAWGEGSLDEAAGAPRLASEHERSRSLPARSRCR